MSGKVTIYTLGMFGYSKTEATNLTITVGPYAQYTSAVKYEFKPKGKRKLVGYTQGYNPSLVVLDGWGHPDPSDAMTAPEMSETGMVVRQTRYASYDSRYATEFNTMINAYIAEKGVKVVADYRGHNSQAPVAKVG